MQELSNEDAALGQVFQDFDEAINQLGREIQVPSDWQRMDALFSQFEERIHNL